MKNALFLIVGFVSMSYSAQEVKKDIQMNNEEKINLTNDEWREKLSPEEYRVLRESGTERAFVNEYYQHKDDGTYVCAGCQNPLFSSDTKYDSGSGWPAFYDAIDKSKVREIRDTSLGMIRVEVRCGRCDGHLGHVFEDGPRDKTGLRYCINSVSLDFEKKK